jgi:AcrR family transcriptional regulator
MGRPADPKARNSLIRAARERFVQHGLKGARIQDITKACGLSKGAFYLHFASKEALFGEVLQAFGERMRELLSTHKQRAVEFFKTEGVPTIDDVRQQTPLYLRYIELSGEYNLAILELCWEYRDVVHIMVRGTQGTAFEGTAWDMLSQAMAHLEHQARAFAEKGTFREGMAAGLVPAMLVGTYSMLCFQMMDMKQKPDFAALAHGINRLLYEGCVALTPHMSASEYKKAYEEVLESSLLTSTESCGLWVGNIKRRNS